MDEDEAMTTTQDFTRLAQFAANPPGPLGWTAPIRRQAQAALAGLDRMEQDDRRYSHDTGAERVGWA